MAKRGRPSRKTIKKRKEIKAKSELVLLLGILMVVVLLITGYFTLFN